MVVLILVSACNVLKRKSTETIRTGQISLKKIKDEDWFKNEFEAYKPNPLVLDSLSRLNQFYITIIGGEWCSDTRLQVPRFFKITETLNFPSLHLNLFLVDRNKDCSNCGAYSKEKYNLKFVPTFIISDNSGREIGRIVETPTKSLEEDLLRILK